MARRSARTSWARPAGSVTRGCRGATLSKLPLLKEILPDQFAPFLTLFVAFLLAVGLDALYVTHRRPTSWMARHRRAVGRGGHGRRSAVVALVPVFVTFDVPLTGRAVRMPAVRAHGRADAAGRTRCCSPFPSPSRARPQPMLWQAVDGMQFRLAGAALKTPNALGGPVGQGAPGSARRILTRPDRASGSPEPTGTPAQIATVRRALRHWQVDRVVIAGASRDPVYASGFFTMALGVAPRTCDGAWVWTLQRAGPADAAGRRRVAAACAGPRRRAPAARARPARHGPVRAVRRRAGLRHAP